MIITSKAKLSMNSLKITEGVRKLRYAVAMGIGEEIAKEAKANTVIGGGPGPHPHRPATVYPEHEDSGFLRDSIGSRQKRETKWRTRVHVYSALDHDRPWNVYLELGWVNPDTGNFTRYPFMWPAAEKVADGFPASVKDAIEKGWGELAATVGTRRFLP